MTACAVTGKNPFEMKIGQASHGADLLGPVMPASVSGRKKSLFYGIPGQMIAREQKFFPEQAAGSGRVPRNRDDPKVRKQGPDLVPPEKDFDAAGLFPEIRFMEYPAASKVPVKPFMIRDVVFMCQKHQGDSSQAFDLSCQGFGESWRIDKNVPFRVKDQVACCSVAFGRMVSTVQDILSNRFGKSLFRQSIILGNP